MHRPVSLFFLATLLTWSDASRDQDENNEKRKRRRRTSLSVELAAPALLSSKAQPRKGKQEEEETSVFSSLTALLSYAIIVLLTDFLLREVLSFLLENTAKQPKLHCTSSFFSSFSSSSERGTRSIRLSPHLLSAENPTLFLPSHISACLSSCSLARSASSSFSSCHS